MPAGWRSPPRTAMRSISGCRWRRRSATGRGWTGRPIAWPRRWRRWASRRWRTCRSACFPPASASARCWRARWRAAPACGCSTSRATGSMPTGWNGSPPRWRRTGRPAGSWWPRRTSRSGWQTRRPWIWPNRTTLLPQGQGSGRGRHRTHRHRRSIRNSPPPRPSPWWGEGGGTVCGTFCCAMLRSIMRAERRCCPCCSS